MFEEQVCLLGDEGSPTKAQDGISNSYESIDDDDNDDNDDNDNDEGSTCSEDNDDVASISALADEFKRIQKESVKG